MTTDPKPSLLQFPCDFPLKIFGLGSDEFEEGVLSIIHKHAPHCVSQSRPSKNGKYLALSVTVTVSSKEQLDAIYQDLSASPLVVMVL